MGTEGLKMNSYMSTLLPSCVERQLGVRNVK